MNNHLQDIHSYYFLDPDDKSDVKPISQVDCEIIHTLLLILERQGNQYLVSALSKWKKDPDLEILMMLQDYLESNALEEHMKEKGGDTFSDWIEKMKKSYISIGDTDIHVNKIFIITKDECFNENRISYRLIINDEKYLPQNKTTWYTNLSAEFPVKEQRDAEYERLKKLLRENTMCKFL